MNDCDTITLTKNVSEQRWFGVSFADTPERIAGETLASPELIPAVPDGPTFTNLQVNATVFNGIAVGSAVVFFVSGGDIGDVCYFAIRVTMSGGSKLVIPCRLIVTKDYGPCAVDSCGNVVSCDGTTVTSGLSSDQLLDAALGPARMKSDNQEVDERSVSELIALDKYLRAKQAACASGTGNPFAGLKFGIICPPGARGRQ